MELSTSLSQAKEVEDAGRSGGISGQEGRSSGSAKPRPVLYRRGSAIPPNFGIVALCYGGPRYIALWRRQKSRNLR